MVEVEDNENTSTDITSSPAWGKLTGLPQPGHLRELFSSDPDRGARFVLELADLRVDFAKQRIDDAILAALIEVAEAGGVERRRDAMFAGEHINTTEDRPVLHIALRAPAGVSITIDGTDVVHAVHDVLRRMGSFADRVRDGSWTGSTGQRIRSVVNIGIGGSDLGPAMAYRALIAYRHPEITAHFVSNVDGADITGVAHFRRTINARLRTALMARDPGCVVPGCGQTKGLEIDHVVPFALGGPTALANLARLCRHHHGLKTRHDWALRGGPGNWEFVPPPTPLEAGAGGRARGKSPPPAGGL